MDTGRIRSGSTAATVRRIHSAIRRFEFERSGLDTCLALAGCRRERPLPRRKPGNGLAARGFGGIDGKEFARAGGRALAAHGRPSARDARSCCFPSRCWSRSSNGSARYRSAPACLSSGSVSSGSSTGAIRGRLARIPPTQLGLWSFAVAIAHGAGLMLVPIYLGLCREAELDTGHEAASDPHQYQSRHGRAGLDRPRHRDDRSPADVWRGWSTAILALNSYRGAGSIWIRPGPSASFWSALLRGVQPHQLMWNLCDGCLPWTGNMIGF